jgi:hypothetical protein
MLNELYTLHRSLTLFRVPVEQSHPWVKRLGRKGLLIAGLDVSGLVTAIEYLDKQEAVSLFKIQENNHSNFPQANWTAPLWQLNRESPEFQEWQACPAKDVRRRAELLRTACAGAAVAEGQDHALSRLRNFCRDLAPRFADRESEFAAFFFLIERTLAPKVSTEEWVQSLSDAALHAAEGGAAPLLDAVEALLAGEDKVPILFDLADCTRFPCRVASPRMGGYFSRQLNATEVEGTAAGICALSGVEMPLETDKMPSPRLPVLGDTVLMSMNPDTPCQMRYQKTGTDIFPLGRKTARALDSALKELTGAGREGKNWKRIPASTKKKKSNLLIVYLESAPLFDAAIAEMFTGSDESESRYSALCAEVCDALKGRAATDSPLLHLFVLSKIDPGRVQVELSEAFTAEQVIAGGWEWEQGARNRPALPLKDDDLVPSPAEVMRCLQMMWERGGASFSDAPGCRLADVYDVRIAGRQGAAVAAATLLRMTLQRTSDLLMAVGHALHRGGKEAWKNISRQAGKNPAIAASLLGITLIKMGHRKEDYMQNAAFLVGRFLSLADTLHAEYCKGVRKGDTPPQLLGNALIPTAISDPNRGLARMLDRIRVYQAWAGKKGSGLARWSCGEIGKIANELAGELTPGKRFDDAERAQLLLGYLARTGKDENRVEKGAKE